MELVTDDECTGCADLNGDGEPDNTLGRLQSALAAFMPAEGGSVEEAVANGDLTVVVTVTGRPAGDAEAAVEVSTSAATSDADHATRLEGGASFTMVGERHAFAEAGSAASVVSASGGALPIATPLLGFVVPVIMRPAMLTLPIEGDPPADGFDAGVATGAVSLHDILNGLSEQVAQNCDCLGLSDQPLISWDDETGAPVCDGEVEAHGCDEGSTCAIVVNACTLGVTTLARLPDLDVDGDGVTDSLSATVLLSGVSAQLL